ncbi:MAG: SUMF1/EgtB/PvdO family nonheme iron enzyme [Bacteroidales bacterium]|nr:SUMF1/EgtB/PvdO family nonheme iron enzyme [Bacteroidales bacterium]
MKKVTVIIVLFSVLLGCSKYEGGELTGVQDRPDWYESQPHGMVFIPMGSFTMGPSEESVSWAMTTKTKRVSVDAFWMDETEITNNEYRQFIKYVKDSILRRKLGQQIEAFLITEDEYGNPIDPPRINWETEIDPTDEAQREIINSMYYDQQDRLFGEKKLDTRQLMYEYYWIDYNQAAKRSNKYNYDTQQYEGTVVNAQGERMEINSRQSFIMRGKVNVYPDTLVWVRDFTYSFNEPYTDLYFSHPAYDDYPVVGVNWEQARAFSIWRTRYLNDFLASEGEGKVQDYRLPTEAEWEYAARGGLNLSPYPWGGPYTRNKEGCLLANFKPMRGNYADDGALITQPVGTYPPNEYGLYDMAGNVAEWTSNAFDESGYFFTNDMNPSYQYHATEDDPQAMKRKVVKGGSWKDVGYYLQNGTRTYEYQDTSKSYIGFRCVRSYLGGSEQ